MQSAEEIIQKLSLIKSSLQERYPIKTIALFGSVLRSDFNTQSDIDILVELEGRIGSKFISLSLELEKVLGRKVDLVSKTGIKDKYFHSIKDELMYV